MRRRIERDVDDEIAFHLGSRVRELMARGESEASARRLAKAEFGDIAASHRELVAVDRHRRRRSRGAEWADAARHEVRLAARSLRRSPAFSIAAIVTLVIGIGASVAIFAVVSGVLLRPLPYGQPERLVAAWHDMPTVGLTREPQAPATYFTYLRLAQSIEGIGVYREGEVNVAEPAAGVDPQRVASASISATLIPVLQLPPVLGHAFTDAEDRPGARPVALISEAMWRVRFGADPHVIGRTLEVNGITREITGVMPSRFHIPSAATQIWVPLQLDPINPPATAFAYPAIARLKDGVTIADAERDFLAVLPRAPELVPKFVSGISTQQIMNQVHPVPRLVPMREDLTGSIAGTLWMVAAAAALVLLVACANVANLTLVRADARQREIAVRQALGAGRGRIVLQIFVESFVLSSVAGGLGLAAAAMAVKGLVSAGPSGIPRLTEVRIDAGTIAFTVAVTSVLAIACSLLPALHIRRGSLTSRGGGRTGTASRVQQRVRGGLVVVQVALAFVVLAGSGLLMRTFERLHAVRPGFDATHVSTFWISLPTVRYKGDAAIVGFYTRLADRVAALPGVQAVGLTSRLPLESHGVNENPLYPEDDPSYATRLPPLQLFTSINGDYFRAMGIPMLAGKAFAPVDAQREGEAIVSRATAQFFWKDPTGAAALGKRFRPLPRGRWYSVIGVVDDAHDTGLAADPRPTVYLPEAIEEAGGVAAAKSTMALVVRMTNDSAAIAPTVRRVVRDLDPTLPLFDVSPMTTVVSAATAQLALVIFVLGGAAAVTLVLGAIGLYGVLAYVVTLRRRELGIRLALGAPPRGVVVAMTRYGLSLAGLGVAGGLMIFAGVAQFLRAQLFGITPGDPVTLTAAVLMLCAMAALASWAPARRAARVNPTEALRAE